mmetsp:Transcript_19718/g.27676  ORF Transcript_19718/g.27676 Transcript_19718/m.27676 type:complete len:125 (-) Transcript_19718:13-387(-)
MFFLFSVFAAVTFGEPPAPLPPPCAPANPELRSSDGGAQPANVIFHNTLVQDVTAYWINFEGKEQNQGLIPAGESENHNSFIGHAFRIRKNDGSLLLEHIANSPQDTVVVNNCGSEVGLYLFCR